MSIKNTTCFHIITIKSMILIVDEKGNVSVLSTVCLMLNLTQRHPVKPKSSVEGFSECGVECV